MDQPNKPVLRLALLGQGFMGKAHSNAFAQAQRFYDLPYRLRLQVLCARDEARARDFAARWGWQEVATDWRSVVNRPDIDVVDIALPNHEHAAAAIAAAEAGKIVWCEKPLANSFDEAERMAAAARHQPTMVWFNYRRLPAIQLAAGLIQRGTLGRIFHYRAQYFQQWGNDPSRPINWKMRRAEAGSGVVGDLLSHALDLAEYLNGPIAELTATTQIIATAREVEDSAALLVRFANGSTGTMEASRFAIGYGNHNALEIQGEGGRLAFDLEHLNTLSFYSATGPEELRGSREIAAANTNFWKPGHVTGYEHTFIAAVAEFLFALHRGERFRPDFADGLRIQRVLDAVLCSASSGAWQPV